MSLKDRVVVITGATGGLGRVVARAFAAEGARLALISNNPRHLEQLSADLALPAGQAAVFPADLRDGPAALAAAAVIQAQFARVDALIHLVGGWVGGVTLTEAQADDLEEMLGQHVWTTFHLVHAFVPAMLANGWGRLIAVSSPSAVRPPARGGIYASAKAAQEALLLSLSQELKGTGVTANLIQVRTIDVKHERDQARTPANASWTTPEEIASAMLYLCSDAAAMLSGARLPLFGPPA